MSMYYEVVIKNDEDRGIIICQTTDIELATKQLTLALSVAKESIADNEMDSSWQKVVLNQIEPIISISIERQ